MSTKPGSASKYLSQVYLNGTLDPVCLTRDSVSRSAFINFLYLLSSCTTPCIGKSFFSQELKSKDPFLQKICSYLKHQESIKLSLLFENLSPLQLKSTLIDYIRSRSLAFINLDIELHFKTDLTTINQEFKQYLEKKELLIINIQHPITKSDFFSNLSKIEAIIPQNCTISKMVLTRGKDLFFYASLKNNTYEVLKGFQNTILNSWKEFLIYMIETDLIPESLQIEKCERSSLRFIDKIEPKFMSELLSIYFGTDNNYLQISNKSLNSSRKLENTQEIPTETNIYEIKSQRLPENKVTNILSNKSWSCPNCNSQSNFSTHICESCGILNKTILKLSKLNQINLCSICSQPSIRYKCRKCLSSEPEISKLNPLQSKPNDLSSGYQTVQLEKQKSLPANPYNTVSLNPSSKPKPAEEVKSLKKPQNFNSKIRSSSQAPTSKPSCLKPNPDASQSLQKSSNNNKISKPCEICQNQTTEEICQICKSSGYWKCSTCNYNNFQHKNYCEVCQTKINIT